MAASQDAIGTANSLPRRLGFWDAFFLGVGTVIGSGVFLTPHTIAQLLPSAGWILVVWVVAGLLSIMGALSIAELGAMYPEAGGLYVYLREAFGRLPAFLYGWALFLIIHTGSAATRSEEHTSELQSLAYLVCRLLLEKKK